MWRWTKALPLGTRLYFLFWTLWVPAGVVLLFVGAVLPGLVVLGLFVVDQALVTPLLVACSQRRSGAKRRLD